MDSAPAKPTVRARSSAGATPPESSGLACGRTPVSEDPCEGVLQTWPIQGGKGCGALSHPTAYIPTSRCTGDRRAAPRLQPRSGSPSTSAKGATAARLPQPSRCRCLVGGHLRPRTVRHLAAGHVRDVRHDGLRRVRPGPRADSEQKVHSRQLSRRKALLREPSRGERAPI